MVCGWRVRLLRNSSERVNSSRTGRPVAMVKWPTISSSNISCLTPKPPPMRGLMTRMRLTGSPNRGATMRRTWKGTWVEVRMMSRSSESHQLMAIWGSIGACCTWWT